MGGPATSTARLRTYGFWTGSEGQNPGKRANIRDPGLGDRYFVDVEVEGF